MTALESRLAESHDRLSSATGNLAEAEDALEALQSHHAADLNGGSTDGNAKITALRAACQQLKVEVRQLGISSALVSCTLMRAKEGEQRDRHSELRKNAKAKYSTGRTFSKDRNETESSVLD